LSAASTSPIDNLLTEHSNIIHWFSETRDSVGGLSHFRNDFGWNFFYPKSDLNLTLQMQACCYQECRAQQNAKNPPGIDAPPSC
jgi:hypothetical protein